MRKLTNQELDEISDLAVDEVENFIFTRISKKEILDFHVNIKISYENELDIDIDIELILDHLAVADGDEIVKEAVDFTFGKLDKFIEENYF